MNFDIKGGGRRLILDSVESGETDFGIVKKYVELGMGISILDSNKLDKGDEQKLDIFPLDRFFIP